MYDNIKGFMCNDEHNDIYTNLYNSYSHYKHIREREKEINIYNIK